MSVGICVVLIAAGIATGFAMKPVAIPTSAPAPHLISQTCDVFCIFRTNSLVVLRLLFGALSFGVFAAAQLLAIGFGLGALSRDAMLRHDGSTLIVHTVLPHAIFELSAFAVAASIEIDVAVLFVAALRGSTVALRPSHFAGKTLIAFCLLFVAAVLESQVSMKFGAS